MQQKQLEKDNSRTKLIRKEAYFVTVLGRIAYLGELKTKLLQLGDGKNSSSIEENSKSYSANTNSNTSLPSSLLLFMGLAPGKALLSRTKSNMLIWFTLSMRANLNCNFLIHPFQKFEQFINCKAAEMTV